jgi:hypothetical protein
MARGAEFAHRFAAKAERGAGARAERRSEHRVTIHEIDAAPIRSRALAAARPHRRRADGFESCAEVVIALQQHHLAESAEESLLATNQPRRRDAHFLCETAFGIDHHGQQSRIRKIRLREVRDDRAFGIFAFAEQLHIKPHGKP